MTAWIVWASKVMTALLGFAVSIVIARSLGPSARGEYFLASTVAVGVFAVCHLSLDQAIFWAVAERHAMVVRIGKTLAPVAVAIVVASVGLFVLVTRVGHVLSDVPQTTVLVAAFLAPITFVNFLGNAVLYAIDKARWVSLFLVGTAVLQLLGVVALATIGEITSATVLVVAGVSILAGAVASGFVIARHATDGLPVELEWRSLVDVGLRNHPAIVAQWLALRADVVIVALVVTKRELGLYSLAVTLAEVILFATDALALSALGRHRTLERDESVSYSVDVASRAARIAAIQVVGVTALGWALILLAYGRSWLGAYPALVCLAPGTIALAYMRPLAAGFIRAGRALERSLVMVAAATVNILGAFVGAAAFGIVGAATASTLAYATGGLLVAWRVRSSLRLHPWVGRRAARRQAVIAQASEEAQTTPL